MPAIEQIKFECDYCHVTQVMDAGAPPDSASSNWLTMRLMVAASKGPEFRTLLFDTPGCAIAFLRKLERAPSAETESPGGGKREVIHFDEEGNQAGQ